MKELYLIYNNFAKEYYLDFGKKESQRNYLGKITEEEVLDELKKRVNVKRKSILYLRKEISVGLTEKVQNSFKHTKINVEIEN